MEILKILVLFMAWYTIGVASFVYWWTKEFDFTIRIVPTAAAAGFVGPVAFGVGAIIHSGRDSKVLFKKRGE